MRLHITLCLIIFCISGNFALALQLSPKEITSITSAIPPLIRKNYVIEENKEMIASAIEKKINAGVYQAYKHPDTLAKYLTYDLETISQDGHLYIKYQSSGTSSGEVDWESWEKEERRLEKVQNFGFTEVEILQGNTGYIKIVEFMHPHRSMPTAVAAMKMVENTEALIIDLRGNGGGYPGIMEYVLSHYFDEGPTLISTTYYSEKDKNPYTQYTSDLIYGKSRAGTPLYILSDGKTGSAAEFFTYTLQAFGKAKVVGQPTAGAAHMNSYYPLAHNFRISISTAVPVNPITKSNWEREGVQPDYVSNPEDARQKALELILQDQQVN
jgi:hypothetical protein